MAEIKSIPHSEIDFIISQEILDKYFPEGKQEKVKKHLDYLEKFLINEKDVDSMTVATNAMFFLKINALDDKKAILEDHWVKLDNIKKIENQKEKFILFEKFVKEFIEIIKK